MLSEVATGAHQKKLRLAVSNPCFELWLYLHHRDVDPDQGLDKPILEQRLRGLFGSFNSSNLQVDRYRNHVEEAIGRAAELHVNQAERWPSGTGTHVYKLAREIRKLLDGG